MQEIDGAAGGGQQLRTALSLSCLETVPFRMASVRGSRPNPGLRPQHLACVEAAATLCDADVDGATEGSETLVFEPTTPPSGDVTVDVGTAGSLPLVFDTVLPLATALETPVSITGVGGTDVKWAPPVEYYRRVKLPLLARSGLSADLSLSRRGFYPVGGGRATLHLAPSSLCPLSLTRRGALSASVHAVAAADLADARVCERAIERVRASLTNASVDPSTHAERAVGETPTAPDSAAEPSAHAALSLAETTATYADTSCPGFVCSVALVGSTRAGFDALGERGRPAEDVADALCAEVVTWLEGGGVVDPHLGDQLVLPLALAGGVVHLPTVTEHLRTNLAVVEAFGYDVQCTDRTDHAVLEAAP